MSGWFLQNTNVDGDGERLFLIPQCMRMSGLVVVGCVGGGERNIVDASGWASAGADLLLVNSCREGSSPKGFDVFFKCLFLVFFLQRRFSFRLMCFYPAQRSAESYLTL